MKTKLKLLSMALIIGFMALNTFVNLDLSKDNIELKSLSLIKNVQAESVFVDGKLYYFNEKLKSPWCILPLTSTHLKCKESTGDYCNPADQTDCKGGVWPF